MRLKLIQLRDDPRFIKFYHIVMIILGNMFLAIGYSLFLLPANIVAGGLGGVGVILNVYYETDPVLFITIATWVAFFLGLFVLGKKFALKTLLSSIAYPLFLNIFDNWDWLINQVSMIDNKLLIGIVGALFSGVGIGLVFRSGGSTGGVDVPGFIVQKYLKINSEKVIFLFDIIVISFALSINVESVLIGAVVALINLIVIDKYTVGGRNLVVVHIISDKYTIINEFILNKLSRGSTLIPAIGGYKNENKLMIEVAIARREFSYLSDYIRVVDPNAFVILLEAKDVYGLGFKSHTTNV